jgi:dUTP pyrophosphatase
MDKQLNLFREFSSTANIEGKSVTYKLTELAELDIRMKKLHPNAILPQYAKDGDAGMDLVATEIISKTRTQITYGTGIAVEIPRGYVGLIFPRSSVRKTGLQLSNSVGVIDSGYRGEIQATFNILNPKSQHYEVGDRICQITILPYPSVRFTEVEELSQTERGEGGFGSTGN